MGSTLYRYTRRDIVDGKMLQLKFRTPIYSYITRLFTNASNSDIGDAQILGLLIA